MRIKKAREKKLVWCVSWFASENTTPNNLFFKSLLDAYIAIYAFKSIMKYNHNSSIDVWNINRNSHDVPTYTIDGLFNDKIIFNIDKLYDKLFPLIEDD